MSSLTYPSATQAQAVAVRALELAKAYEQFVAPRESPEELEEFREGAAPEEFVPTAVDAIVDWRDRVPIAPSGDQGRCYACTGFAIAAGIEINSVISHSGTSIRVSPGYIHTCVGHSGDSDPNMICLTGADLFKTLNRLMQIPYAALQTGDYPFPTGACPSAQFIGTIKALKDLTLNGPQVVAASQAWLFRVGPLLADMQIWRDFFSYTTHQAPAYVPDVTSGGPWLHSVCVIGFNEAGWLIKNSMGPNWGDGRGCATIAYHTCGLIEPLPGSVQRSVFGIAV